MGGYLPEGDDGAVVSSSQGELTGDQRTQQDRFGG
jgi:hypothetical protein